MTTAPINSAHGTHVIRKAYYNPDSTYRTVLDAFSRGEGGLGIAGVVQVATTFLPSGYPCTRVSSVGTKFHSDTGPALLRWAEDGKLITSDYMVMGKGVRKGGRPTQMTRDPSGTPLVLGYSWDGQCLTFCPIKGALTTKPILLLTDDGAEAATRGEEDILIDTEWGWMQEAAANPRPPHASDQVYAPFAMEAMLAAFDAEVERVSAEDPVAQSPRLQPPPPADAP
jgi:hypothetical protein